MYLINIISILTHADPIYIYNILCIYFIMLKFKIVINYNNNYYNNYIVKYI